MLGCALSTDQKKLVQKLLVCLKEKSGSFESRAGREGVGITPDTAGMLWVWRHDLIPCSGVEHP